MKMGITKVFTLALLLCVFGVNPAYAAPKIVVGANLKEYKHPTKKECDIVISPKQYPTIQAGIDAATPGDTVCVGAGTFNENVKINKSIRLSGRGASKSIINGQITNEIPGWLTVYVIANDVTLEGFLIKGVDGVDASKDATVVLADPLSGAVIRHNRIISGNGKLALRADSAQDNNLIENNVFEGNNSPFIVSIEGVKGPSGKVDVISNTLKGTVSTSLLDSGVVLNTFTTNSLIKRNAFDVSGEIATIVSSAYSSNVVTENNLNSTANVKVGAYSDGTLNAENNWWGDLDPSDNIQGDIDYTPFVAKPFKQRK